MFSRSEQLLGADVMQRLHDIRVIIFGVGGVGSWCAESLIRTGLQHLTIVDYDMVQSSNINRQSMANTQTIGQSKVEIMRSHLLSINPNADIIAVNKRYTNKNISLPSLDPRLFSFDEYDFIIDAIDSLDDKLSLILAVTSSRTVLFSSMGAAGKIDPTQVRTTEFWKVRGCPLARALRTKMKKQKQFPLCKFQCVYSEESQISTQIPLTPKSKGSLMSVTATFGLTLTSMLISALQKFG